MESYPNTRVTRYGIELLKEGIEPHITYISPDKDMAFYINGGLAPFPGVTEGVVLENGIDGMHASFRHLDHKGARQDGVTWADTVFDEAEMTLDIICTANTPEGLRSIIRKWLAAWDPERKGTLSWVTPDAGEWWCHPRLFRAPVGRHVSPRNKTQKFKWSIRNDDAFWRSHDSVSEFRIAFQEAFDNFARDDVGTLGPNWEQTYTGPGAGVCETQSEGLKDPGRAVWTPNDPDTFFTGTQRVVIGPFKDYSTPTDGQEVSVVVANTPEYTVGTGAANHIWGRMGSNPDGTWDGNGIRASFGWGFVEISAFVNFEQTVLRRELELFPPLLGDKWTLVCVDGEREFTLLRNDFQTIIDTVDEESISALGPDYRGVGFGLQAGGAILTQATPAEIRTIRTDTVLDTFEYTTSEGLGENWPLDYYGSGEGYVRADGDRAGWVDTALGRTVVNRWLGSNLVQTVTVYGDPTTWTLSKDGVPTSSINHSALAADVETALEGLPDVSPGDVSVSGDNPYEITFTNPQTSQLVGDITSGGTNPYVTVATTSQGASDVTATDNQIISVKLGDLFEFPISDTSYIDIWGRMDDDDENPTGIRLRIGPFSVKLSRFNAGVETEMDTYHLWLPTLWNQTWTLICGTADNPRQFIAQREGWTVINHKEKDSGSALGSDYRHVGFGMESGDGTFTQRIPPSVLEWYMGDNGTITQSGHLTLTNFGDQPGFPDYVVYGPGTFVFADGPGVEPTIEFGPLEEGQVALVKTHPGQRGVYDLTHEPMPDDLPAFQDFIKRLISFAFNSNIPPLMNWFQSLFGIPAPQGNLYSLLKGRFSKPIPPKPVTGAPVESKIAVTIVDGNANSKVVAALTPLRRWPE